MAKYLIIGNSAGAVGALEAIKKVDVKGSCALVSEEPYVAYSRPAIAEYLMGERAFDQRMHYRDQDYYVRNGIEAHLGVRATRLHLDQRQVELSDGRKLEYEKLLLATGGQPIVPRMEGLELQGIYPFITIEHARKLDEALKVGAKRVVVIGGGLIGCSLTHALAKRGGVEVAVVELLDHILTTMTDAHGSALVEARLKELGVVVMTGRRVTGIFLSASDPEHAGGVTLENGERVEADLVGMAVGVSPRLELARGTAVVTNRGIVVDRHMETSVPGVYACGDVAEAYDFIFDTNRVVAIWPNAYIGGRIAGFNMAGEPREYDGCTVMNAFSYFGIAMASAGMFNPAPDAGCEVLSQASGPVYKKAVLKQGRIVGFILMEEIEQAGVLFSLMRSRTDVASFKDKLLTKGFGLVSLPKAVRDSLIWGDSAHMPGARLEAGRKARAAVAEEAAGE